MNPSTWDAAEQAERVREQAQRLAAMRGAAPRWAAEAWWIRRLLVTAHWPRSAQHALAAGVIASIPPARLAEHLRASAPRRDDAA